MCMCLLILRHLHDERLTGFSLDLFPLVYWTKYSYYVFTFSVGYSVIALNHVIDFKEKKQVIFCWDYLFLVCFLL